MEIGEDRRLYLEREGGDFRGTAVGHQVIKEVRFSTDPRDFQWVRENVPCQAACPANTNVPGYIRAIFEDRYGRSYELNRLYNVFPGVLGRVCSRPCEAACRHGYTGNGEPVAICMLKRAAADHKPTGHQIVEHLFSPSGKSVAIVGAGPAGLAAAHDLAIFGHEVTLFEALEKPGGMLYYGIPEFRLPRRVLDLEIGNILRLGVELHCGVRVGQDVTLSELRGRFDALLLAAGCYRSYKLEEAGPAPKGVYSGLDFLMRFHQGETVEVGERVHVIGDGFTAMDCSRMALRLGAKEVVVNSLTTEEHMPVTQEELFEAKHENVEISSLVSTHRFLTDSAGRLTGIEFLRSRLGAVTRRGQRIGVPIANSHFTKPADTALVAIGQGTDTGFLDLPLDLDDQHNVAVDAKSYMTNVAGVFGAGDFVTGASTVVQAIGHGRRAARAIDAFLVGRERKRDVVRIEPVEGPLRERSWDFIPRQEMPTLKPQDRLPVLNNEVELGYDRETALEEAKRCYLCYLKFEIDVSRCIYCRACIEVAPKDCIKLAEGIEILEDGTYGSLLETKRWDKVAAIAIDNEECIRCGNCYRVCPTKCISVTKLELIEQNVEA